MKSDFEYKDEYWKEAEKLIIQEENKKKKSFYFALSFGIAAIAIFGTLTFFKLTKTSNKFNSIPTNQRELNKKNLDETTGIFSSQIQKNHLTKQNSSTHSPVKKSLTNHSISNQTKNELTTSSHPNLAKFNSNSFFKNSSDSKIIQVSNSISAIDNEIDQAEGSNQSMIKTSNWELISIANRKPFLANDISFISPLKLEQNYFSPKNKNWKKEVFIGLMLYPSFQNHGIQSNEVSFNLGCLMSKNIKGNWFFATGIQYNNYRKLYDFSTTSSYQNNNSELTVSYFSSIENQTWTPISSSDSLIYSVQGLTLEVDSGPIISYLPFSDTINLSSSNPDYLLNIDRKVKEKTVLVGAIQIPIEVHYQKAKFRVSAGASAEMYLFNKIKVHENERIGDYVVLNQQSQINNSFDLINRFNLNAALGIDYFILNSISIGLKGTLGLTDLLKNDFNLSNQLDRNYTLNFSLRYHW